MAYQLVARSGPIAGNIYKLEREEIFIGRDLNNDVVVNDPEVSRRHSRLFLKGTGYVIEDLGSTNGTSVNGQRLVGPYALSHGAQITLGENINFSFEAEGEGVEATVVSTRDANATMRASIPAQPAFGVQTPPVQSPYVVPEQAQEPQPYGAPQPSPYVAEQPPASDFLGQVPSQPVPAAPAKPKKKVSKLLIIAIVVIVLLCCLAGAAVFLYYADTQCYFGLLPGVTSCPAP